MAKIPKVKPPKAVASSQTKVQVSASQPQEPPKVKKPQPAPADKASSTSQAEAKDAFELVRLRNFYYRDGYRRLLGILLMLGLMLVASMAWVYYLLSHRPAPRYFATNVHGALIPLQPLTTPTLSNQALSNWAARAANAAFSLNYVQYREQIENAKDTYFTESGGQQYQQQLVQSNDLAAVINGNYVVVSQPTAAPTIIKQGVEQISNRNVYAWHVNMPLVVNFFSPAQTARRFFDVNLTIIRSSYLVDNNAPNLDGMKGIGVNQLLVQSASEFSNA